MGPTTSHNNENQDLKKQIEELRAEVSRVSSLLEKHQHQGKETDGTSFLGRTQRIDGNEGYRAGGAMALSGYAFTDRTIAGLIAGRDENPNDGFRAAQITIEHQDSTDGSTNQTFFYGYRFPLYSGVNTATYSNDQFAQDQYIFVVNELAGAYLNIYTDDGDWQSRLITSNTKRSITVSSDYTLTSKKIIAWVVMMPVYLGSADYPWRRLYITNDIRFGTGTSGGSDVVFIKYGTGSPEGVVTANIGSLYLRTDGGSGTTLYVKEASNGANTGWSTTS